MNDYSLIVKEAKALIEGVPNLISNLSNIASLLFHELKNINWAGFYFVEGDSLVLYPFCGKPACTLIPIGKGVCGTAVSTGEIQLVKNVHEFPGHIACDSASNSEIVLPIRNKHGEIVAVLDIDSPLIGRFDETDKEGLIQIVDLIEDFLHHLS